MHKPTLYEFQDAVTTGAARRYIIRQGTSEEAEIVEDVLWELLEERRWPVYEMVTTDEGRAYFETLGRIANQKLAEMKSVDQQG